jgi:hypothetical protein
MNATDSSARSWLRWHPSSALLGGSIWWLSSTSSKRYTTSDDLTSQRGSPTARRDRWPASQGPGHLVRRRHRARIRWRASGSACAHRARPRVPRTERITRRNRSADLASMLDACSRARKSSRGGRPCSVRRGTISEQHVESRNGESQVRTTAAAGDLLFYRRASSAVADWRCQRPRRASCWSSLTTVSWPPGTVPARPRKRQPAMLADRAAAAGSGDRRDGHGGPDLAGNPRFNTNDPCLLAPDGSSGRARPDRPRSSRARELLLSGDDSMLAPGSDSRCQARLQPCRPSPATNEEDT